MRLLVTGAAGMLGRDVVAAAERAGHDVVALARRDLDIRDSGAVAAALADARPDTVVNCAAWTDVDGAEGDEVAATAVNGAGAGNVAGAARAAGAFTVHVSSDYVFDGDASEPYDESAAVAPLSAYGRSKLAGERAAAQAAPGAHAIVRSAWLFGVHGRNFVDTILRLGAERQELTVVDDQFGSPTFTGHLAPALIEVGAARTAGVLHVAGGPPPCSWFQLACVALESAGLDCKLMSGRTVDLARPAPRPAFSALASARDDAPRLPSWRDGLAAYLGARAEAVAAR